MKKRYSTYQDTLKNYIYFLKKNKLYQKRKKFFYENNIEKMFNWTSVDFKKTFRWYNKIKNSNKTIVKTIHFL